MKGWPLVIITILATIIFESTFSLADSHITISYIFLNTTEAGTTTIAAMELEATNNDAFEIKNLNITLTSPAGGGIQGSAEIKAIPSNGSGSVTGAFTAPKGLFDIEPLFFEITYTDKDSQEQKAIIQGTKR